MQDIYTDFFVALYIATVSSVCYVHYLICSFICFLLCRLFKWNRKILGLNWWAKFLTVLRCVDQFFTGTLKKVALCKTREIETCTQINMPPLGESFKALQTFRYTDALHSWASLQTLLEMSNCSLKLCSLCKWFSEFSKSCKEVFKPYIPLLFAHCVGDE